jgi:hypothetical protein
MDFERMPASRARTRGEESERSAHADPNPGTVPIGGTLLQRVNVSVL